MLKLLRMAKLGIGTYKPEKENKTLNFGIREWVSPRFRYDLVLVSDFSVLFLLHLS